MLIGIIQRIMVHLDCLKIFVDVAEKGSFRASAEKNFMTQPAVSQQIRQLEEKLGTTLFERQNKRVFLTESGRNFLPYAQKILKQYAEAKLSFNRCDVNVPCIIRIATIYSIGLHELKPVIKRYLKVFPQVEFHLEYHPFHKIYDMVFNREIDFGLVAFPFKRHGIVTEIFEEEELVLVQSHDYPVLKGKVCRWTDLHGAKFVSFASGTPTRDAIDQYLSSHKICPLIFSEYDNVETLKSAVELGIGCSIIPKNAIRQDLKEKVLDIIPSVKIDLKRSLGILYPKGKTFSKCTQTFYEMVMDGRKKV